MSEERKKTLRRIGVTFGITSLCMIFVICMFVYVIPYHPYVKRYQDFTESLIETLEEKGITVREDCEFVGGWYKHPLFTDAHRFKVIFRFPETTPLEEIVSPESWNELKEPEYDPPARERELGDFTFTKEAKSRGGWNWIYLTEVIDGYYYLRVCLE